MTNTTHFCLPFDPTLASLEQAGGKGMNLARTSAAGMPVPPGFIISTSAYRLFIAENQLDEQIQMAAADSPAGEAATIIQTAFQNAVFPEQLSAEICAAYVGLNHTAKADHLAVDAPTVPVAVRSSATAEDLAEASFAGQQESYLNIRGEKQLLDAVRRCFASLWTERAIAYRAHQNIAPEQVALAVVVQQMVFADLSGVMFTADPTSGSRDWAVIDAAWGLGEALVGGLVTPDHLLIDKSSGRVLQEVISEKTVMTVPTTTGTEERSVEARRRRLRVLEPRWIEQLTSLANAVETHYRQPMDIEWAIASNTLYLLQARPITTLPAEPVRWDPPTRAPYIHGGGSLEMIIEPVSPFFATFGLPLFAKTLVDMLEGVGLRGVVSEPLVTAINGYVFVNIQLRLRPWHLFGVLRNLFMHMDSMQGQVQELALYRQRLAELVVDDLTALSCSDLLARITALSDAGMHYWIQIMKVVQPIYRIERRLIAMYEKSIRRPADPEPEILLRGQKVRPWEAECSVYLLAQRAQELAGVPEQIVAGGEDVLARLENTSNGRMFLAGLRAHLAEYGDQLFSFDLQLPTLADDPRAVLAEVVAYLQGKESPIARQERMAAERSAALAMILPRLSNRQRQTFEKRLAEAQGAARMREDALFEVGLAWTPMHRAALELGRRLAAAGVIAQPEDLFWLEKAEVTAAAEAIDRGEPTANLHMIADRRRQQTEMWRKVRPPYVLPVGMQPKRWWGAVFPVPELQKHPDAHTLVGLGVSPGKVTATARVIEHPADLHQLQAGEILVAHTTTPAWTPLFARAAALVTDLGGPLAHGSIVAREYGIPAVMGTGSATQKIKSGQTITVNGSEGIVKI